MPVSQRTRKAGNRGKSSQGQEKVRLLIYVSNNGKCLGILFTLCTMQFIVAARTCSFVQKSGMKKPLPPLPEICGQPSPLHTAAFEQNAEEAVSPVKSSQDQVIRDLLTKTWTLTCSTSTYYNRMLSLSLLQPPVSPTTSTPVGPRGVASRKRILLDNEAPSAALVAPSNTKTRKREGKVRYLCIVLR